MVEKEGKTAETAIEAALEELQADINDCDVEVIRKEGLFKTALVRVSKKNNSEQDALKFMSELLNKMNLDIEPEVIPDGGKGLIVNLNGRDNGIAIGYRGEVLDALQYLASLAINKTGKDYVKVTLDAENYRDKRTQTLEKLALRLAEKAIISGRVVEVEPMNPYERKVFHTALADNPNVRTESEGEEPNRYVVITPLSSANKYDPVINDFKKKGVGKIKSYGVKRKPY
jgi:spoIIIJ-associated protein